MFSSLKAMLIKHYLFFIFYLFISSSYVVILMFMLPVELERQSFCDLNVLNKTEYFIAFKVPF